MFKIDFINGKTISWDKENGKAIAERHPDYYPRFYLEGDISKLQKSRSWMTEQRGVKATCFEEWRPTLSKSVKKVLRIDCTSEDKFKEVAGRLKKKFGRSAFRFYNVGFFPSVPFLHSE